jgi:hypothetical protein
VARKDEGGPPKEGAEGGDLNWTAPWIDVCLWVELAFWLMVNNTAIDIEVEGHKFRVALHDN